jgi:hypothetical protein
VVLPDSHQVGKQSFETHFGSDVEQHAEATDGGRFVGALDLRARWPAPRVTGDPFPLKGDEPRLQRVKRVR